MRTIDNEVIPEYPGCLIWGWLSIGNWCASVLCTRDEQITLVMVAPKYFQLVMVGPCPKNSGPIPKTEHFVQWQFFFWLLNKYQSNISMISNLGTIYREVLDTY